MSKDGLCTAGEPDTESSVRDTAASALTPSRSRGDNLPLTLPYAKAEQGRLHDVLLSFSRRRGNSARRRTSKRAGVRTLPPPLPRTKPADGAENSDPRHAPFYSDVLHAEPGSECGPSSADGRISRSISTASVGSTESNTADTVALCSTPGDGGVAYYLRRGTGSSGGKFRRLRMPGRGNEAAKRTEQRYISRKRFRTKAKPPSTEAYAGRRSSANSAESGHR